MPRVTTAASARISTQRKARGLAVDQLVAASSIDSSNIRAFEAGRALTSLQSLVRIAEALQVEPTQLLEGAESGMFSRPKDDAGA